MRSRRAAELILDATRRDDAGISEAEASHRARMGLLYGFRAWCSSSVLVCVVGNADRGHQAEWASAAWRVGCHAPLNKSWTKLERNQISCAWRVRQSTTLQDRAGVADGVVNDECMERVAPSPRPRHAGDGIADRGRTWPRRPLRGVFRWDLEPSGERGGAGLGGRFRPEERPCGAGLDGTCIGACRGPCETR